MPVAKHEPISGLFREIFKRVNDVTLLPNCVTLPAIYRLNFVANHFYT